MIGSSRFSSATTARWRVGDGEIADARDGDGEPAHLLPARHAVAGVLRDDGDVTVDAPFDGKSAPLKSTTVPTNT